MRLDDLRQVIAEISTRTEVRLELDPSGNLLMDGTVLELPQGRPKPGPGDPPWYLRGEKEQLLGTEGALPSVPRADLRDRLLWTIVEDAVPKRTTERSTKTLDVDLRNSLIDRLPATIREPAARAAIAGAMQERFFSPTKARRLLAVQTDLPAGYSHGQRSATTGNFTSEGYRLFNGRILPFLLWNGDSVDRELIQRLLDAVNNEEGLTRLDLLMLGIARDQSGIAGGVADSDTLTEYRFGPEEIKKHYGSDNDRLPSFDQVGLDRFRADLQTILEADAARTDRVGAVGLLLGLHISLLLMRLAFVRGRELDALFAAATGGGTSEQARSAYNAFKGSIKFRVGIGAFESVSLRDPCHTSWKELVQKRLMNLLPALVASNLTLIAWEAAGGPGARRRDMPGLVEALTHDQTLRSKINAATQALAAMHRADADPAAGIDDLRAAARPEPGPYALMDEIQTSRRKDLRHQGRDIINTLMRAEPAGRLLGLHGKVNFFEVDESLLSLLVQVICRKDQIRYSDFLDEMAEYGLSPQHPQEEARMADLLERLGFLTRYSDSGEATYVHAQL